MNKTTNNSCKKPKNNKNKRKSKSNKLWVVKVTVITLVLSLVFSFISEITASKTNVIIALLLLVLLIAVNIIFDGIGIAAASCDIAPLLAMSAKKISGANIAVMLVKNAEKVSNICADVIGDICGIISGAAAVTIVLKFAVDNPNAYVFNILVSSLIAAITVGGKAAIKSVAIKNSKELILFASRIIGIFYHPKIKGNN